MSGPISADEVSKKKKIEIPDTVYDVVNSLIIKTWSRGSAKVYLDDVYSELRKLGMDTQEVFNNGWLNFEEAYRDAGWAVSFESPGFNEQGSAGWMFSNTGK